MEEIFKDIQGYEGLYQVSNYGNVKALKKEQKMPTGGIYYRKEKILSSNITYNGYLNVRLFKEGSKGKGKGFGIHRLVAKAFIPNPKNLPQVNHIDGNKQNNYVDNLEWCDASFNQEHALKERLKKVHKVEQYDLNGNYIKTWNSIKDITTEFKVSHVAIISNIKGKTNSCKGYKWKYK